MCGGGGGGREGGMGGALLISKEHATEYFPFTDFPVSTFSNHCPF